MPFPALNIAFIFSLITTFVGLRHTDQDMPKPWVQFKWVPQAQTFLQICLQHHCCTFQDQNLELLQIIWTTYDGFWPENLTWLRNCPEAIGKATHLYAHLTCSGVHFRPHFKYFSPLTFLTWRILTFPKTFSCDIAWMACSLSVLPSGMKILSWEKARLPIE